jgi:copper chaperone CopZ
MNANIQRINKKTKAPIFGVLTAAILASICCLGPIVLAMLGVGGAGLFSKFANLRPYFFGLTAILLGTAFYFTYRKRKVKCEDGTCKIHKASKWNKIVLWIATVLVVFFLAFPYLIGALNTSSGNDETNGEISEVAITVKGMTCSGCEFNVEKAVKKLNGIIKVKANHKKGKAHVLFKEGQVTIDEVMQAINKAGYKATDYEFKESK